MKKSLIILLLSLLCQVAIAQISGMSMFQSSQKFVEDAVVKGLFVVNQKYCLADDSLNYYGRGGNDYFGTSTSLGIKIKNGYLIGPKAVFPQNYDPNFNEVADRYKAVNKKTEYKNVGDSIIKTLPFVTRDIDTLVDERVYYYKTDVFDGEGFVPDVTIGEKEGWLVWLLNDGIHAYRQTIIFTEIAREYNINRINMGEEKDIIGGIFVVPVVTAIGQITFQLAGVIDKNNSQWIVVKLPRPSNDITPITLTNIESQIDTVPQQIENNQ